jgi:hypothetical protein
MADQQALAEFARWVAGCSGNEKKAFEIGRKRLPGLRLAGVMRTEVDETP